MKLQISKNKWIWAAAIITFLIVLFGIVVNYSSPVPNKVKVVKLEHVSKTLMPFISNQNRHFAFFTVQTNIIVMTYFILVALGILKPNSKKSHKIFEGISLLSIFITFFIYWTILAAKSSIWSNPLLSTSSVLAHFILPTIMFIGFFFSNFKDKEVFKLENKDFVWFLIYPLLWLILILIIYYATLQDVDAYIATKPGGANTISGWEQINAPSSVAKQMWDFSGTKNLQLYHKNFNAGMVIYFFFNFKYVPVWLPIVVSMVISILFIINSFLFISLTNKESKIRKLFKRK